VGATAGNQRLAKAKRYRETLSDRYFFHFACHHNHTAVTTMFASASGMNRRQPKSINWSYRKRGHIQRTQMNIRRNRPTFPRKMPMYSSPPRRIAAG